MNIVFPGELPTELKVMPFSLRVMKIVGLWENRQNRYRFWTAFWWGTFIILVPKAVLGIGSDQFDAIAKGIAEAIYNVNLVVATAIFVTRMAHFKRMVDLLTAIIEQVTGKNQPVKCYEEIRKQNRVIDKFAKFCAIYVSFGPFIFCVPSFTTSYLRYFTSGQNDSEQLQFDLPMEQEFYGMNIRTDFVHYHIFVALSLSAYYCVAILTLIKVPTMIIMMKYCALVFRLIVFQIEDLSQLRENASKSNKLARIVRLHESAFQVTRLAEKILNLPLMLQFMSCMMFWCLAMFYASTNLNGSLVNVMVLFCLSLIEAYSYSYLGSEITDEAAAVGSAILNLPWYEESVELQNKYRLVLQRSQCVTGITAAKFFFVGVEQFGKIAQMSYSYYLVLKDSFSEL